MWTDIPKPASADILYHRHHTQAASFNCECTYSFISSEGVLCTIEPQPNPICAQTVQQQQEQADITLKAKVVIVVVIVVVAVVVLITIGFLHDCISLIAGSGDRRKDRDPTTKPQSQHQLHQLLQVIFLSLPCVISISSSYICHQLQQLSFCLFSCCFIDQHLQKLDFVGTGQKRRDW